jgi:hypothetical protein
MMRRLVEASYYAGRANPSEEQVRFWLREARTPEILLALADSHSALCRSLSGERPLLESAVQGHGLAVESGLAAEESGERQRDRESWRLLKEDGAVAPRGGPEEARALSAGLG